MVSKAKPTITFRHVQFHVMEIGRPDAKRIQRQADSSCPAQPRRQRLGERSGPDKFRDAGHRYHGSGNGDPWRHDPDEWLWQQ